MEMGFTLMGILQILILLIHNTREEGLTGQTSELEKVNISNHSQKQALNLSDSIGIPRLYSVRNQDIFMLGPSTCSVPKIREIHLKGSHLILPPMIRNDRIRRNRED